MKVGIDVLETSRVKTDDKFLKSFLNESEIEYVSFPCLIKFVISLIILSISHLFDWQKFFFNLIFKLLKHKEKYERS